MSKNYGPLDLEGWLLHATEGQVRMSKFESMKVSELVELSRAVADHREQVHARYKAEIDSVINLQQDLYAVAEGLRL